MWRRSHVDCYLLSLFNDLDVAVQSRYIVHSKFSLPGDVFCFAKAVKSLLILFLRLHSLFALFCKQKSGIRDLFALIQLCVTIWH